MGRHTCRAALPPWAEFIGMLLLISVGHAHSTPIYKSTDAMGNVTYSATPPADAVQFERVEVTSEDDFASSAAHEAIIDEIRATAELLEAERKQRELAREAARIKEQESDASGQVSLPPQPVIQYYPVYPLQFAPRHRPRLHRRPPDRHRPEQQPPLPQRK